MVLRSDEPEPGLLSVLVVDVPAPGSDPAVSAALEARPGVAAWVTAAETPEMAGSLILQAVKDAKATTTAVTTARRPTRLFPRDSAGAAELGWSRRRAASTAPAVAATLAPERTANACPSARTSGPRFQVRDAGRFSS